MARTRRRHRSGSSGLRSPTLKRHPNLKALRLRLVAVRQPFGPFCTACRRKRRWTCSSKARHPRRLRTRQQIRPKSRREWCSSNTRLLNRSRRARRCQKRGRALASALACGSLVTSNVKGAKRSAVCERIRPALTILREFQLGVGAGLLTSSGYLPSARRNKRVRGLL
jgi:hypothetical protein